MGNYGLGYKGTLAEYIYECLYKNSIPYDDLRHKDNPIYKKTFTEVFPTYNVKHIYSTCKKFYKHNMPIGGVSGGVTFHSLFFIKKFQALKLIRLFTTWNAHNSNGFHTMVYYNDEMFQKLKPNAESKNWRFTNAGIAVTRVPYTKIMLEILNAIQHNLQYVMFRFSYHTYTSGVNKGVNNFEITIPFFIVKEKDILVDKNKNIIYNDLAKTENEYLNWELYVNHYCYLETNFSTLFTLAEEIDYEHV